MILKDARMNRARMFLMDGDNQIEVGMANNIELIPQITVDEGRTFSLNSDYASLEIPCDRCEFELNDFLTPNMIDNVQVEFKAVSDYVTVPKRRHKHKKNRVTKKWIKRYGSIQIPVYTLYRGEMTSGGIDKDGVLESIIRDIKKCEHNS